MYGTYLYDGLGSITMTITNLSAGSYSFYLYGHGNADNQNSVFQLTAGSQGYGTEATINGSGWLSSVWQEGVQYVEFTNVNVAPGQTITIAVEPGANNNAVISGLQIASTPVPFIVSQPAAYEQVAQGAAATFSVTAGGTAPLAYQWLFDGTNISAATNSSYSVTNAQCANAGNYSVIVTNAFGIVTSIVAELNVIVPPVAPFTKVIDVDFTGVSVTSEIGIAATGVTTSDFWNTYNLSSGTLTNLKFMDGTASGAGLTVANVQSEYGNGAPDPMYGSYLYNQGGNMTVTITDLDAGAYDFYIYGHGSGNNQDGIYQLTVGWQSYGTEATINGPGWLSSVWQEGAQYVEFTNVLGQQNLWVNSSGSGSLPNV
jgi:hypothetical protein